VQDVIVLYLASTVDRTTTFSFLDF